MLHLRIADEVCRIDVEAKFEKVAIEDRPVVRKILEKLEGGTYCTLRYFCGIYEHKLDISHLSTGCKAALLTVFAPTQR